MQKSFIISLVVAVLLIVLVLQNAITTKIQFFFWDLEAPLMLLLFIVILLGALISALLSLSASGKRKKELKAAKKTISELEMQLRELQDQKKVVPQQDTFFTREENNK